MSGIHDTLPQGFWSLTIRVVAAGFAASSAAGRIGRATRPPPQLGQSHRNRCSAHSRQKVHSKEQISASVALGGRSLLQHSQLGRSSSMANTVQMNSVQ